MLHTHHPYVPPTTSAFGLPIHRSFSDGGTLIDLPPFVALVILVIIPLAGGYVLFRTFASDESWLTFTLLTVGVFYVTVVLLLVGGVLIKLGTWIRERSRPGSAVELGLPADK